jgi:DHA2 family lincomycin resistance protein-like MFS transporter
MLGTLQQVAAAFGTALVVTVMSARAESLIADGAAATAAQLSGMRLAFAIAAGLALLTVIVAIKLPRRVAPHKVEEHSGSSGSGHVDEDERVTANET